MLNIDLLRYNWEKPFLDLIEGIQSKTHPDTNEVLWYKDNDWYFKEDPHRNILHCSVERVFMMFQTTYWTNFLDYGEIRQSIRYFVTKHLKTSLNLREQIAISGHNDVTGENLLKYFKIKN